MDWRNEGRAPAQSSMEAETDRFYGFDVLRFLMVLCVIMLHSAMTYMALVPEWWYVIDRRNSLAFTMLVVFLDAFPMSALLRRRQKRGTERLLRRGRKIARGGGLPALWGRAFCHSLWRKRNDFH